MQNRAIALTTALVLAVSPHALGSPDKLLASSVAHWDMSGLNDATGANSTLEFIGGDAHFEQIDGALDGNAVRLEDAALVAGQGADGEINLAGDAFTVLVRLRNEGTWDTTLFSKHGGHDLLQYNIFAFELAGGDADIGFEVGTRSGFAKAPAVLPADESRGWRTIVGRYDGATLELLVDGQSRGSAPLAGALRPASGSPLVIGGEAQGDAVGRRFTGWIDEVAMWDRALSDDEIKGLTPPPEPTYDERWRPQVHFSPPVNWINDPNGMIYHGGEWHLFYQHNPFGDTWGHMSWGHAVSTDLIAWEHLPLALAEENGIMIFSGSAVHDRDNSAGFAGAGEPSPLVAVYTGHHWDNNRQHQSLAFSTDRGRTWTKHEGNPVIDLDLPHHRDPKVFWHDATGRWIMAVSLALDFKVQFYGSENLRDWDLLSEFGPAGATGIPNWECPELFELPIENRPGESRWVLQIDIGNGGPVGGSAGQYFVGDFDGTRFINENPPETVLWLDHGQDCYAAQAFNDAPDGRAIYMAWMNNWDYANAIPTSPWRGSMTIPREVRLKDTPAGIRLVQEPAHEWASRFRDEFSLNNLTVTPGDDPLDRLDARGDAYELFVTFEVPRGYGNHTRFGVRVHEDGDEFTLVGYDPRFREMFVDRRKAGRSDFHQGFASAAYAPLPVSDDGTVSLRVVVDRSSVEVFGNDGEAVITSRVFPTGNDGNISLFAERSAVKVPTFVKRVLRTK